MVLSSIEFPSADEYDHPVNLLADVSLSPASSSSLMATLQSCILPVPIPKIADRPPITFRRLNNDFIAEITTHNANPNICSRDHPPYTSVSRGSIGRFRAAVPSGFNLYSRGPSNSVTATSRNTLVKVRTDIPLL